MNYRFGLTVGVLASLFSLTSCNLYTGFASPNNDDEYIQEAQKCLREGNYTCALEQYGRIGVTDLKNEKICLAQLTRAGLGITQLVNTIAAESGSSMLGKLSTALIPWTEEKETATIAAVTECNKLATINDTQKQSLLRVLAYFTDCAIRIAKTDSAVAISESTTSCNSSTAGDGDATIESTDIATNAAAALSGANSGMCQWDAKICATNIEAASNLSGGLGGDLGGVSGNISDIPDDLKDSSSSPTDIRAAIIQTLDL